MCVCVRVCVCVCVYVCVCVCMCVHRRFLLTCLSILPAHHFSLCSTTLIMSPFFIFKCLLASLGCQVYRACAFILAWFKPRSAMIGLSGVENEDFDFSCGFCRGLICGLPGDLTVGLVGLVGFEAFFASMISTYVSGMRPCTPLSSPPIHPTLLLLKSQAYTMLKTYTCLTHIKAKSYTNMKGLRHWV